MKTFAVAFVGLIGSLAVAEDAPPNFLLPQTPIAIAPSTTKPFSLGLKEQAMPLALMPQVNLPAPFDGLPAAPTAPVVAAQPRGVESKLIVKAPTSEVDCKLIIQAPDPRVDYKLRIK